MIKINADHRDKYAWLWALDEAAAVQPKAGPKRGWRSQLCRAWMPDTIKTKSFSEAIGAPQFTIVGRDTSRVLPEPPLHFR